MTSQKAVSAKRTFMGGISKVLSKLSLSNLKAYVRGVQSELKKIHWASRTDLARSTRLVLVATVLFGFLVYFADLGVRGGLELLKALFRMIS